MVMIAYFAAIIPSYETDERSSLGRKGLALPVADAARPFRVQRSTDAKERRRRRQMSGTATGIVRRVEEYGIIGQTLKKSHKH